MSNAPPSADPADADDLVGVMRTAQRKFLQGVDDCLPCVVIASNGDRSKQRVTVRPLVDMLTTDNRRVPRPQVASVPVMQFGAGGFVLSFVCKPGDLGWLKANDRDISLFLQGYAAGPPNTLRLHTFEDAVFIPDPMTGFSVGEEDAENAVLQNLAGTVRVSLGAASLTLEAAGAKTVYSAAGMVHTVGPVTIAHTAAGLAITGGPVIINGIPFDTHRHTGVVAGGDNSGGPIP